MTLIDRGKQISYLGYLEKVDILDICLVYKHALVIPEVKVVIHLKSVLLQNSLDLHVAVMFLSLSFSSLYQLFLEMVFQGIFPLDGNAAF